jgi:hypothetical protein
MRKTDKKIDNQLRLVLTEACEIALKDIHGFQWLTHLVNYSNFPKSLKVVCVFDTNENLSCFMSQKTKTELASLIQMKLHTVNIEVKNVEDHIFYDTEQNSHKEHHGKWASRLLH